MHKLTGAVLTAAGLAIAWPAGPSWAQVAAPNAKGVSMGHVHYRVRDLEANKKFWVTLGAVPLKLGAVDVMKLPDILIVLEQGESSGGNEEAVINHISFRVPSVKATLEKLAAAGFPARGGGGDVGNMITPQGEAIEIFTEMTEQSGFTLDGGRRDEAAERFGRKMTVPIASHHIHFELPSETDVPVARAWYVTHFGALPGERWHYVAADLPGINLNFREKRQPAPRAPTKGRMLDHIGFEVKNLEQFCRGLQAAGVKFDIPYTKNANGVASAFLTDPWGTYIELTEGLSRF